VHFAIFQTWGLGDLVMTTPIIAEFRRIYPDARLTLIVQGKAQVALMEDSPLVDQILDMPPRSDRLALLSFFLGLRRQKIDAAFIGTRISSWLPWVLKGLTGVPEIIGDDAQAPFLYSVRNKVDPTVHRVDRMLETFALWSRHSPMAPRFPIPCSEKALHEARSILADIGLRPRGFVVLHPGSGLVGGTEKRIPVDVARRVADDILDQRAEFSIAFIFGPDEVDFIRSFTGLGERQVILSGHSLSTTIALISQAAGFIGTDSSLGHIAAAFDVPTVTLFGPTIASETAPYGDNAKVIKRLEKLGCQPCWGTPLYGQCPYGVRCMHELPESEIVEMAKAWDARDLSS
jgi:heptosyltransferase-2